MFGLNASTGRLATITSIIGPISALIIGLCPKPSQAVIVDGPTPDGTYNTLDTTPIPAFPGFKNVGTLNGSTGVYLGNGYVITAGHVGVGGIALRSVDSAATTIYNAADSGRRLLNPDGSQSDALIFKISPTHGALPDLPTLNIASVSPMADVNQFYLSGNGISRADVIGSMSDQVNFPGVGTGYNLGNSNTLNFGTATATDAYPSDPMHPMESAGTQNTVGIQESGYTSIAFATLFADANGAAQAIYNDSGGGAFNRTTNADGSNTLAGLIVAISFVPNQNSQTVVFGDLTYAVDLATYRSQILQITGIPEPSTAVMTVACGWIALARRRRSMHSRLNFCFHRKSGERRTK